MLRAGLLKGHTVKVAGARAELRDRLEGLGALVLPLSADQHPPPGRSSALEERGAGAAPVDTLVADARADFGAGGYDGVRAAVDGAFATTRDVATAHWIDHPAAGQAVLIAPAPAAGAHAGAARAALENLVRTLSTEWARHRVTTVAVLPGDATTEATLADLVAWLASPAGAYISGTALTLDRPR